jgi:two-component system sensor histidine kinase TctE
MRLFQRTQHSLFGEILDWMLTPLLLLWPVSLALTWLVAQSLADKPFDRALIYNVQALAQLIQVAPGSPPNVRFSLPQPASELLRAGDSDSAYYQVRGVVGEVLSGERDLPAPPPGDEPAATDEPQLRDAEFRGLPVRIASLWVPVEGARGVALVQVAETREKRSVLAAEIIKGVMLPQFVILPLAVLLVWLALVRGIKPLSQLEERIRARRPDDLSPLDEHAVPQEVGPLVDSVNGLLTRLQDSIAMQKRFLADAAHQLKTPLAGLRMQADLAQRQGTTAADLKQSLKQIGHASARATHTVNQLLALARAEGGAAALARQPCDIAQLSVEAVREAVPRALERRVDLGYEGPEPGASELTRPGNPTLLKEMIRNLLDNALNYTPSSAERPGVITLRVRGDPLNRALVLQVEDNGPGIPALERERIFEPFYRALGTNVDGSGLGLPIVREIAHRHDAQVEVSDAHPGQQLPGALFSVRFQSP